MVAAHRGHSGAHRRMTVSWRDAIFRGSSAKWLESNSDQAVPDNWRAQRILRRLADYAEGRLQDGYPYVITFSGDCKAGQALSRTNKPDRIVTFVRIDTGPQCQFALHELRPNSVTPQHVAETPYERHAAEKEPSQEPARLLDLHQAPLDRLV